jgi:hypothetical protein
MPSKKKPATGPGTMNGVRIVAPKSEKKAAPKPGGKKSAGLVFGKKHVS